MPIRNKKGEELKACTRTLVCVQGPCLDCIRPGQWLACAHSNNRAREKWLITGISKEEVEQALRKVKDIDNFEAVSLSNSGRFSARWYTPILQWLDVVDISLSFEDEIRADAYSKSVACCPAACPGALLCSVLLCCVPFLDHGKNLEHLALVRKSLEDAGGEIQVEVLVAGKKPGAASAPAGIPVKAQVIDRTGNELHTAGLRFYIC